MREEKGSPQYVRHAVSLWGAGPREKRRKKASSCTCEGESWLTHVWQLSAKHTISQVGGKKNFSFPDLDISDEETFDFGGQRERKGSTQIVDVWFWWRAGDFLLLLLLCHWHLLTYPNHRASPWLQVRKELGTREKSLRWSLSLSCALFPWLIRLASVLPHHHITCSVVLSDLMHCRAVGWFACWIFGKRTGSDVSCHENGEKEILCYGHMHRQLFMEEDLWAIIRLFHGEYWPLVMYPLAPQRHSSSSRRALAMDDLCKVTMGLCQHGACLLPALASGTLLFCFISEQERNWQTGRLVRQAAVALAIDVFHPIDQQHAGRR